MLSTMLAYGITTARNPAAPTEDGVALRDSVASGAVIGPRIYTSGYALSSGTFGPYVKTLSPEQIRREIEAQAVAGVDYIKVYASLRPELIEAAVAAAHEHGLKVVRHLQRTTWTEAADYGIDAITHGSPWSRAYLLVFRQAAYDGTLKGRIYWLEHVDLQSTAITHLMDTLAGNDVTIDPTLIAHHTKFWGDAPRYLHHPDMGLVPRLVQDSWQETTFTSDWSARDFADARDQWPKLQNFVKLLYDTGVLITAGSDTPNPWVIPGISLHEEMRLLEDTGIPAVDVLKIATLNGARSLGIDTETGSIEVAKRADLVVLTRDPLLDLSNTIAIKWVIKGGEILEPAELLSETGRYQPDGSRATRKAASSGE